MKLPLGFSLIEVLLSLMLVGTLSLGLLTQQLQVVSLFQQVRLKLVANRLLDNNVERKLAKQPLILPPPPFKLTQKAYRGALLLKIAWGKSFIERWIMA